MGIFNPVFRVSDTLPVVDFPCNRNDDRRRER